MSNNSVDWTRELQNYIRLDTSPSGVSNMQAVDFLVSIVRNIEGLVYRVFISNKLPILVVTKPGISKQSILFHSHIDVASVGRYTDNWKYSPFSGTYDKIDDAIYGRGSQSMKSQSIQYLAALSNLAKVNTTKTVHLSFVHSETHKGFTSFIRTQDFTSLNVEFVITEGCVSPTEKFLLFNTERTLWRFNFTINSAPGYVAMPFNNTTEIKFRTLLNAIADFRTRDAEKGTRSKRRIGETTTINITNIETIRADEVLFNKLVVSFDMYIGRYMSEDNMIEEIQKWARLANGNIPNNDVDNIKIDWIKRVTKSPVTEVSNPMCENFLRSLTNRGVLYNMTISPGYSDASVFRHENIPVIGFTPINNTPPLIHNNNEYVKKTQFLENIDLLTNIIRDLTE